MVQVFPIMLASTVSTSAAESVLAVPALSELTINNDTTTTTTTTTTVVMTKLAFGSCHKNKYATGDVWASIAAKLPQAFLWVGDSIYPPTHGIATIEHLQHEYQIMLLNNNNNTTTKTTNIGYHTLLQQQQSSSSTMMGIYGMYDDHDWGGNDMGKGMPRH
jgi:C4-dicarboxylate transporter